MREGNSIILTGSTAATTRTPVFGVYSASKAAIRSFAQTWILELAPRKIQVNVLVSGATSPPGWHDLAASGGARGQMIEPVETTSPLGRLGEPKEGASAALFLASEESGFVNGSEPFADGGSAQIEATTKPVRARAREHLPA